MACLRRLLLTGRSWLALELSFPAALHFCQHDMRTGETVDACPVGNWPCPLGQEYDCVCWSCDLVMPACLPTQSPKWCVRAVALAVTVFPASLFSDRGRCAARLV